MSGQRTSNCGSTGVIEVQRTANLDHSELCIPVSAYVIPLKSIDSSVSSVDGGVDTVGFSVDTQTSQNFTDQRIFTVVGVSGCILRKIKSGIFSYQPPSEVVLDGSEYLLGH